MTAIQHLFRGVAIAVTALAVAVLPSAAHAQKPAAGYAGNEEAAKACASVLTEMNCTPLSCSAIMRLTALPPPPPTPTTFIRAFCADCSSSSKCSKPGHNIVKQVADTRRNATAASLLETSHDTICVLARRTASKRQKESKWD